MGDEELECILTTAVSVVKDSEGSKTCNLIREKLDRVFGPAWHVIIGKNFGCYAVHDKNKFVNFTYRNNTYLVYKTTI